MRRMTKKEIEDFQRRYEENKQPGPGRIAVRIVETGQEFESLEACALYLRVSVATISRIMNSEEPYGDIQIERVSESHP